MKNKSLNPTEWHQHVEQCRNQEISQAGYCRRHNLILTRFGYWHRKFNAAQSGDWLPVEIEQSDSVTHGIDLVLGNKRTLHISDGFDKNLLQQIIIAIEATP